LSKTVVGLFDDFTQAQRAVHELESSGIPHSDISLVASNTGGQHDHHGTGTTTDDAVDGAASGAGTGATTGAVVGGGIGLLAGLGLLAIPGFGPIVAAGWLVATLTGAGIGAAAGGLLGALVGAGVPHEEAHLYNEGVRRGGTLIAVKTADNMAHQAAEILGRYGAVDIDERADTYRQPYDSSASMPATTMPATASTGMPVQASTTPQYDTTPAMQTNITNTQTTAPAATARTLNENEVALPVVEEELQVGKREVQRGGVRVYTHVTETPVQEQVHLHEEHINVERRPVDRPITAADAAFREESVELRETAEVPVVNKQARVVEEVVVGKTATDRVETISDTVRRTDVEVEQLDTQHTRRNADFSSYETDFRSNYNRSYGNSGMTYDQYAPAYKYGYDLQNDPRYRGKDWNSVQSDVQRDWESRQPGTWEKFSNAIRYSWDKATGSTSDGIQTGGRNYDGSPDTRGVTEKIADTVTGDRIDDKTGKPTS